MAELATCYASAKQFDDARLAYVRLCKLNADQEMLRPTCEFLASAALAGGDVAWAGELFAALSVGTNPPEAIARGLLGLGRAQLMANKPAEAEATLARLIDGSSDAPCIEASLLRGQALERLEKPESALAMYERMLKLSPPDSADADAALDRSAQIYVRLQRWDDAARCCQRLAARIKHRPDGDAILYRWAWAAQPGRPRQGA